MATHLVAKEKITKLKTMLEKRQQAIQEVLPKHLTPERMIKVVIAQATRMPKLLDCTPLSIINGVMVASQLGLEPDGTLGGAYLIPYRNRKTGKYEAQFIIGYRGLIDLARRSGQLSSIEAHVVYENDEFECQFGLNPVLNHKRDFSVKKGVMIAVYAVARFRDAANCYQYEVMSKEEVDKIRALSKTKEFGPWVDHYDEMARKTVVRRLCKYLPLTVEMQNAFRADNDTVTDKTSANTIDLEPEFVEELEKEEILPTKADEIIDDLDAAPQKAIV